MDNSILQDPIWATPITSKAVRQYMGAIRDYHIEMREEGNALWKDQVDGVENPDVELMMQLKRKLEQHGVYAQLAARQCARYDAARFEARQR